MGKKFIDTNFLKRLERLSLNIERLMNVAGGGLRKSRAKGSSIEFSDFREYSPGDDLRKIDWNAYGRFDRFFIKLFMEEREAFINVFIDTSKSMAFDKKSDLSIELAAALSYLSLINMDRLCINLIEEDSLKESEVFGGRGQFNKAMSFLEKTQFQGLTNLSIALKKKKFIARGLTIIISDFFTSGDIEEIIRIPIFNKQEIVLIHILSPEEYRPTQRGNVKLKDAETGEEMNLELSPPILDKYEKTLRSFIEEIKAKCKKHGGIYINTLSNETMEKVVFEDLIKGGVIV